MKYMVGRIGKSYVCFTADQKLAYYAKSQSDVAEIATTLASGRDFSKLEGKCTGGRFIVQHEPVEFDMSVGGELGNISLSPSVAYKRYCIFSIKWSVK